MIEIKGFKIRETKDHAEPVRATGHWPEWNLLGVSVFVDVEFYDQRTVIALKEVQDAVKDGKKVEVSFNIID